MNLDPRIGKLAGGQFYAFCDGYDQPEFVGTLSEVQASLGLTEKPDIKRAELSPHRFWDVRLTYQYPAWDQVDGLWYRGIAADCKSKANAEARRMALDDGHLSGGQGRVTFVAFEADRIPSRRR